MNEKLTLEQIASWQLNPEQSEVELPTVQRGFVWKTEQVEDLWDSLLREYPIGSFLFSKTGKKFNLMDGQQRATSIFLGFLNPFSHQNNAKAWAIKGELPIVWIDLHYKEELIIRKYLIRLTTRSHPWGYQAKNHGSILSVADRRKALTIFRNNPENTGSYTSFKNTTTFPYDASYPLPLCFFIESEIPEQVIEKSKKYLPDYFCTKHGGFENKNEFLHLLDTDELKNKIQEILFSVKKAKENTFNFDIVPDSVLKEEEQADKPTLFVRINSSGTPLSNDDLIYSIYKAIFPETREAVEDIGMDFISPTKAISLVSRIAWSSINGNNYPAKMNVSQFQQRIRQAEFKKKLQELIKQKIAGNLFKTAIRILQCNGDSTSARNIPPVIVKQFVNKSPELFLFFVYWLYTNELEVVSNERKLKMVAKLLTFSWFEFGNIPRLWEGEINNKDFWEKPLNQHIWWDNRDGIHFLIPPSLIREYYQQQNVQGRFLKGEEHRWGLLEEGIGNDITTYYNRIKSQEFDSQTTNKYFWEFIRVLQHCKPLVLFAQRDYINATFSDYNQMESVEDTNVPWDWDHIYPSGWIYWKPRAQILKDWNNSNGNFRAISLEQNRSESDSFSPKRRLESPDMRETSFIKENDWEYWQLLDDRITSEEKALVHFRAITERMINIYEKYWDDLKIGELIDDTIKVS